MRHLPTLYAEFELEDGKPVKIEDSYRIVLSTTNVPAGTKHAKYGILDESFDKRKFKVGWVVS